MSATKAHLTGFAICPLDGGDPGYRLETPFGQTVQVLPRPPRFVATLAFEWEGAMPDEIAALADRARTAGLLYD